jgi:hypothetical protein
MTVIEFFDRESAVENIAGALICKPEKVVFIGSNAKRMKKSIENYNAVFQGRGIDVEFSFRTVGRNNLDAVISAIEDVIAENGDCKIDISGGDELFLVAVGVIFEKYKNKIEIRRFNVNNNSVNDCNSDGCILKQTLFNLGVDENIRIYAGRVIYTDEKANSTFRWNFNDEFISDIKAMWDICRRNAGAWNAQANSVAKLCNENCDSDSLRLSVKIDRIKNGIYVSKEIFQSLEKCGVIKGLEFDERFSFSFKNKDVMKCITKAGQLLELIIAVVAKELKENGENLYNDVGTGVYIDWDGVVSADNRVDVENEMDVILMKGMIPVFVSCKNGTVDSDELYKLSVVAERFGGKYARKVLVASRLDEMGYKAEYIRARAKDMGIKVVENIDEMDEKELCNAVAKLWK